MSKFGNNTFHVFNDSTIRDVTEKLQLREDRVASALADAINTAAEETVRLSVEEWNSSLLTQRSYVHDKIKITSRASSGRPQAMVSARSRATRADNFKYAVQPGRKGVRLNVMKSSSGAILKNAFVIPNAKSNNRPLIMARLKKYQKGDDRRFTDKRFKALYGPSVNQHFYDSRERVAPKAMSSAKQQFLRAIET